jgi:hypothetical protein
MNTYTLPNGTTRTRAEIASALERVEAMPAAQTVTGWSSSPISASAAAAVLRDALDYMDGTRAQESVA